MKNMEMNNKELEQDELEEVNGGSVIVYSQGDGGAIYNLNEAEQNGINITAATNINYYFDKD